MSAQAWKPYQVVFRAESPTHIGWHNLGLISRTRYYVAARNVWGTLVAALAPRLKAGSRVPHMYTECRTLVGQCLRFTPLFALEAADDEAAKTLLRAPGTSASPSALQASDGEAAKTGVDVFRPRFKEGEGLMYGRLTPEEFENRFVFSQSSAALYAASLTAEDGALHESEFLSPVGRRRAEEKRKRLYFLGYFVLRDSPDLPLETLQSAAARISVGADQRYGWGRLALVGFGPSGSGIFDEFDVFDADKGECGVRATNAAFHLPAHLEAGSKPHLALEGDIEMLSGRDWDNKKGGAGRSVVKARPCWAPGSRGKSDPHARFIIQPEGYWTRA